MEEIFTSLRQLKTTNQIAEMLISLKIIKRIIKWIRNTIILNFPVMATIQRKKATFNQRTQKTSAK